MQAFDYHLDPATGAKYYSKIKLIDDVSAPDDLTVVLHTSQPLAVLPLAITDIRIIDVDNPDTINTAPNGTGPFKVTEFVPDDHVTLERNDDYFGDPSPLDSIEIVKIADSTAAPRLCEPATLTSCTTFSFADAGKFGEDPDYTVVTAEPYHWTQTWKIDTSSAPFDKVEARQALSYATDRQKILDVAYYGFRGGFRDEQPVSPDGRRSMHRMA